VLPQKLLRIFFVACESGRNRIGALGADDSFVLAVIAPSTHANGESVSTSRAIRAAAVAAALFVPFSVCLGATAVNATPAPTKLCNSTVKHDFNGDGHADIAVTQANETSTDLGKTAVRVLYGSSTGITKSGNQYLDGSGVTGFTPANEDLFGIATAIGDFNGDGCADLAVDAAGITGLTSVTPSSHGGVVIYYGSPSGLQTSGATFIPQASIVPAAQATSSFLQSATAGNFNKDAYDDLVVGVPDSTFGDGNDRGGIAVLYGSATGLTTAGEQFFTQATSGVVGTAESGDEFGTAVAAGDFNGNGYDDIAIGAPEQTVGSADAAGTVTVLYGSATGITATGSQQWSQSSTSVPGTAQEADTFGEALAAGDINKDGKADLIVGTPGDHVGSVEDAGTITLLKGSSTGLTGTGSTLWSQQSSGVPGTSEESDEFGTSVAIGDLNGDGYGDVAVGVPGEAIGSLEAAGEVNVLYGNSGGLTGTGSQGWYQNSTGISGSSETGDQMGEAVAIADLTSSKHGDLVIGVPGEDSSSKTDNGLLNVILGSTAKSGLTATCNQGLDATGMVNGPVSHGELGVEIS
jgi:hypothetical protein